MKKNLFFAALAITALVSCSESDYLGDERPSPVSSSDDVAIEFGSGLRAITRADVTGAAAADLLNKNFVVYGVKSDGTPFGDGDDAAYETVFDHYNVNWVENTANTTTSNTADWEYVGQTTHPNGPTAEAGQTIKFWDYAKSQYDFIAYSKGKDNSGLQVSEIDVKKANGVKTNDVITDGAYQISGTAAQLAKAYIADLVTVYRGNASDHAAGNYGKEVDIKFRSLSAKVRIGLYEIIPGYSVKDVVFYSAANTKDTPAESATWGDAHLFTTGNDVFNGAGTYIVYYPTTGADKAPGGDNESTDYNKAHVKFVAADENGSSQDMTFGTLTGSLAAAQLAAPEKAEADAGYLGRSSNTAIYAGAFASNYYTIVIPNEEGAVLNLKVDYTLVSTDGDGETIHVTGATAQVPAVYAQWKSGYAYTYLFKISQNGNGYTDPSLGPAGLYPITLDAVVVNDEADGIQETITTVAEPSITTYSKGAIVTANNEYVSGNIIYVVVEDGGSNATLSASNAKLYTVTIEDGAAQTINEASIANALANGTQDPDGTWTVTDANSKNLVVTSTTLTIGDVIAAADSPTGNEITVGTNKVASFTAGAVGTTYVFQYIKTPATYYEENDADIQTHNNALSGAITTGDGYTFTSFGSNTGTPQYGTGKVRQISQVGEWTTVLVTSNNPNDGNAANFVGQQFKVHATTIEAGTYYELYTLTGAATGIYVTVESYSYVGDDVNAYNATLPGAVKVGDVKTPGEYGYKIIKIAE
ncbi:MAG: hypothetical protein II864_06965 [Prevotella sp.]|nr:hypothetical protein [Prevotella sp.]